ncbi:MAG: SIS domain-containing protein [Marinosulfonomonas sp.]
MTNLDSLEKWATWRELQSQPKIWADWGRSFDPSDIRSWIDGLGVEEVWFCGAGTSAYIGEIIVAGQEGQPGPRLRSVASTDLVARPQAYLTGNKPLVVSFGRSGNSAESIGTLDVLDALAPDAPRLHITCNGESTLATRTGAGPSKVIVLPDATHDAGFAMTSSFSTMLLTALSLFDRTSDFQTIASDVSKALSGLLPRYVEHCGARPGRAVYLGSGPLAYAAREAALKVMELSAGQIPALWDSTLGFRHGPKSFVTGDTAITVFCSPDSPTSDYDVDLISELHAQFPKARVTSVGPGGDIDFAMPHGDTWSAPLCVAAAQIASVMWSADLGLNVDDPFVGQGTLSRVVAGVKLYPVTR